MGCSGSKPDEIHKAAPTEAEPAVPDSSLKQAPNPAQEVSNDLISSQLLSSAKVSEPFTSEVETSVHNTASAISQSSKASSLQGLSIDGSSAKGASAIFHANNNASVFYNSKKANENGNSLSSIPIVLENSEETKPRVGTRSILHLERTTKFAAFCLRAPGHHANISARPKVLHESKIDPISQKLISRQRALSQQTSTKMIGDLRHTLHKLNSMRVSPGKRAQLIRLDSTGMNHLCCLCKKTNMKGLMCEKEHFTCINCFGPHVERVCKNTKTLKKDNFGIHCPLKLCDSACWNSYHVRKLLDGPSLELYIDSLVSMCREEDLRNAPATTATVHIGREKYPVQTLEILRNQIRQLNMIPLEYIPLDEINEELQMIFDRLNSDLDYNEARMEFLLMCMKHNPEYIAEEEEKTKQWREEMAAFTGECLAIMRGYVPPHVFEATLISLQEEDGFPKELAKRLLSKKCLWLIRMNTWDIERIHEAELMGRFNPVAQGLDAVEMAAVFASVPEKFLNDPTGRKTEWRNNFEASIKEMDKKRRNNALKGNALRNSAYKKLPVGPFIRRMSMRKMEVTTGFDSEIKAEQ